MLLKSSNDSTRSAHKDRDCKSLVIYFEDGIIVEVYALIGLCA
jgi:hypothetical protein